MGGFFVSGLIVGVKSIAQAVPAQHTAGGAAVLSGSAAPAAQGTAETTTGSDCF